MTVPSQDAPPVFATQAGTDYNIEFPAGPITMSLNGSVDPATLDTNYVLACRIPIIGTINLGNGQGNLKDGITNTFNMQIISGSTTLYENDGWMCMKYDLTILGAPTKSDVRLVPLPQTD